MWLLIAVALTLLGAGCLATVGMGAKALNDQLADATQVYQVTYTITARPAAFAETEVEGEAALGAYLSADLTYATQPGEPSWV